MSADSAVNIVSEARGQRIPETPEQLDWIKQLPSHRLVVAS